MLESPQSHDLSFEDNLGMLVDREWLEGDNRRVARRTKETKRPMAANIEEVIADPARCIDKCVLLSLAACPWIKAKQNIIIHGATGVGKSFLGASFAQTACRHGYRSLYVRVPRFVHHLSVARADGSHASELARISRFDVLVRRRGRRDATAPPLSPVTDEGNCLHHSRADAGTWLAMTGWRGPRCARREQGAQRVPARRLSPPRAGAHRALRSRARQPRKLYGAIDDGGLDIHLPKHAKGGRSTRSWSLSRTRSRSSQSLGAELGIHGAVRVTTCRDGHSPNHSRA
jgi:hypothetical protein